MDGFDNAQSPLGTNFLDGDSAPANADFAATWAKTPPAERRKLLDANAARLAAAESEATGPINVGTGIETDVLELAARLGELGGGDFEPEFAPAREGEVQRISIDPARAAAELGWKAEMELAEGLRVTLDSL